jgi:hypothetical protein
MFKIPFIAIIAIGAIAVSQAYDGDAFAAFNQENEGMYAAFRAPQPIGPLLDNGNVIGQSDPRYKAYNNSDFGISFEYPSDFSVVEMNGNYSSGNITILPHDFLSNSSSYYIHIAWFDSIDLKTAIALNNIIDTLTKKLRFIDFKEQANTTWKINGNEGIYQVVVYGNGLPWKEQRITFSSLKSGRTISIIYQGPDSLKSNEEILNHLLATWKDTGR